MVKNFALEWLTVRIRWGGERALEIELKQSTLSYFISLFLFFRIFSCNAASQKDFFGTFAKNFEIFILIFITSVDASKKRTDITVRRCEMRATKESNAATIAAVSKKNYEKYKHSNTIELYYTIHTCYTTVYMRYYSTIQHDEP